MKKYAITTLFCAYIFYGLFAADTASSQVKTLELRIIIQNESTPKDQTQELRKLPASKIFQSVANSCQQLGKLVAASDSKEKQQQTCNLVASILQFIADASKKDDKKEVSEKKESVTSTKANNDMDTKQDKRIIRDQAIEMMLDLVNAVNNDESLALRSPEGVYLSMLRDLPSDEAKSEAIEKILEDENHRASFLDEIINTLKHVLFVTIPTTTKNLLDYLKSAFE